MACICFKVQGAKPLISASEQGTPAPPATQPSPAVLPEAAAQKHLQNRGAAMMI